MTRCNGKGYEECGSCLNREHDPMQCDDCEDGDLYEPDDGAGDGDDFEEMDLSEFRQRYAEDLS
jgi:hypothetical protein